MGDYTNAVAECSRYIHVYGCLCFCCAYYPILLSPMVATIEGFHCILIFRVSCTSVMCCFSLCTSADNAKMGLVETRLAIIPGGG